MGKLVITLLSEYQKQRYCRLANLLVFAFDILWSSPSQFKHLKIWLRSEILQDIPMVDDGNSHNFFCALRLVVDNPPTDQQKIFPQSARTKCVKPLLTKVQDADVGTAKWDELFIFEVPQKVSLQIVITHIWYCAFSLAYCGKRSSELTSHIISLYDILCILL